MGFQPNWSVPEAISPGLHRCCPAGARPRSCFPALGLRCPATVSAAVFGAVVFSTALLSTALLSTPAHAQTDAGAPAPERTVAHPEPTAAERNAAEPLTADRPGPPRFVPKTLQGAQRLPENLQGWLHERGASRSAGAARAAVAEPAQDESPRAANSRRVRSFDEEGITVLSNRLSQSPTALARAQPVRVAEPAPRPRRPEPTEIEPEADLESSHVTETHSLRAARSPAPRRPLDDGFGWATLAAAGSALGLAVIWFRRRGRTAHR